MTSTTTRAIRCAPARTWAVPARLAGGPAPARLVKPSSRPARPPPGDHAVAAGARSRTHADRSVPADAGEPLVGLDVARSGFLHHLVGKRRRRFARGAGPARRRRGQPVTHELLVVR